VTEVFRVNGVSVRTQVAGAGRIAAEAVEPNADKLNRAADVVRRDVRGLQALECAQHRQAGAAPRTPGVRRPRQAHRLAGARRPGLTWSPPTVRAISSVRSLPTGHRITQIDKSRVTLELHGQSSTLDL
jgi:hypothetical protein